MQVLAAICMTLLVMGLFTVLFGSLVAAILILVLILTYYVLEYRSDCRYIKELERRGLQ
jgi:general stress protein CsbA